MGLSALGCRTHFKVVTDRRAVSSVTIGPEGLAICLEVGIAFADLLLHDLDRRGQRRAGLPAHRDRVRHTGPDQPRATGAQEPPAAAVSFASAAS
jgi:hypothetical protein